MAEPRARLTRNKGAVFPTQDLSDLLYAYGDTPRHPPSHSHKLPSGALSSTIATLDEILTDFIIETCHYAALSASYSRRQKIKVDDFKFVLRRDEQLLGRVLEQLWREKRIKEQKKAIDFEEFGNEGGAMGALEGVAAAGGVTAGEMKEKGRGKGKGKRKRAKEDGEDGGRGKRVAT